MPDSSELLKNIVHYQKSLHRYSQTGNDTKILHCILKLYNMPVTISHLEETGIGRTVNALRKMEGEIGDAAKTLVAKWKEMVSGNDDDESERTNSNESDNSCKIENKKKNESNSSHKHSDRYKINGDRDESRKDNKHKNTEEEKYNKHNSGSTSKTKHRSSSNSEYKSSSVNKETKYQKTYESDSKLDSEENSSSNSTQQSSESENVDSSSDSEKEPRYNKYESDRKSNHRDSKHRESSTDKYSKRKQESEERKRYRSSSRERTKKHDVQSERYKNDRGHNSSSSKHNESRENHSSSSSKSSSKRRHETATNDDDEPDRKIYKKSSHDSQRSSSSSKSKESSSREHKKENKHESDKKDSKNISKADVKPDKKKYESNKEDRSKSEGKSKSESSSKNEKNSSSSSKDKSRSKQSSKSSSSSGSSKKDIEKHVNIGSDSGTSFAEALGMLEPTTSRPSKKSKGAESTYKQEKVDKPDKNMKQHTSKEKVPVEKPSKLENIEIIIPPPPPQKMDLDISSLLPTITPNYRPVANPFLDTLNSRSKIMNDDEALSMVMSQKNLRTKVYSGNKCFYGNVPTLFDLCIRVLQDNIDALEYTGGVPYSILKPIIDKATPDQLFVLEHHNPYLIEDTDDIWHFHCQKEFRNKKREELESWREMYMRCLDEREAKLKALTENIKLAQDKSIPVRQTKLAYVDSVVKPPRDVLRKQAKSGIDKKPVVTPSARLTALTKSASVGQVSVPNPVRASSSGTSSAAIKHKKAPLMQKTLALLKGSRFRR